MAYVLNIIARGNDNARAEQSGDFREAIRGISDEPGLKLKQEWTTLSRLLLPEAEASIRTGLVIMLAAILWKL